MIIMIFFHLFEFWRLALKSLHKQNFIFTHDESAFFLFGVFRLGMTTFFVFYQRFLIDKASDKLATVTLYCMAIIEGWEIEEKLQVSFGLFGSFFGGILGSFLILNLKNYSNFIINFDSYKQITTFSIFNTRNVYLRHQWEEGEWIKSSSQHYLLLNI